MALRTLELAQWRIAVSIGALRRLAASSAERLPGPLIGFHGSCTAWRFTRCNWRSEGSPCRSQRSGAFWRGRRHRRHHPLRSNRNFTDGRSRDEDCGTISIRSNCAIVSSPNLRLCSSTSLPVCRPPKGSVQRPCQTRTLHASTGSLGSP